MKATAATQQTGMKQQEFEKLFSEHSEMVYRAAYSVTGNNQEAKDVLQDVFLKLIDSGRTLEFTENPAGYLFRMAINEAHQRFRTRTRKYETDDGLEELEDTVDAEPLRKQDIRERLLGAMAQLEPEHAEVLVLWAEHGYSDAEIARMVGKSRSAAASMLHRAKARLKELMGEEKEVENS